MSAKKSTLSTSSAFKINNLFKKKKINEMIKDSCFRGMIDVVNSKVYCFKVKGLYTDVFKNLKKICEEEYCVKLEYNSSFNMLLFHEISFKMNVLKYNPDTDGNINDKNKCEKISGYEVDNFPEKTRDCYYFLKSRLNIIEEGLYNLQYLTF